MALPSKKQLLQNRKLKASAARCALFSTQNAEFVKGKRGWRARPTDREHKTLSKTPTSFGQSTFGRSSLPLMFYQATDIDCIHCKTLHLKSDWVEPLSLASCVCYGLQPRLQLKPSLSLHPDAVICACSDACSDVTITHGTLCTCLTEEQWCADGKTVHKMLAVHCLLPAARAAL